MRIMLAAMASGRVIGFGNRLPWQDDGRFSDFETDDKTIFRKRTMGHVIIQGRKTFESVPGKYRPLPGRFNIVVTRDAQYQSPGITTVETLEEIVACNMFGRKAIVVVTSLEAAFALADQANTTMGKQTFVIGGAQIYEQAMTQVDQIILTVVHYSVQGDVLFPPIPGELFEMLPSQSTHFGHVPRYRVEQQVWQLRRDVVHPAMPPGSPSMDTDLEAPLQPVTLAG